MYGGVIPFYIWHVSFLISFFFWLVGLFMSLPFQAALWLGKQFNHLRDKITAAQNNKTYRTFDTKRRAFLQKGFTAVTGTVIVGTTYAGYAKDDCEIVTKEIFLKNLPESFDGFTIGMLSDVHSSVFMTKSKMRDYALKVNALACDIIVITGDHVNSLVEEVYPFAEAFTDLKARDGVYGVLGNHDFFTPDVDLVCKEIEACGIRLLRNEGMAITKNGSQLYLLGIDDTGNSKRVESYLTAATRGCERNIPKILLCHRPYFIEQANNYGIDLTLSGHTHGGQIVIAKLGRTVYAPARIASPYIAGLYSFGNTQLYVNRGIGTVGPPIRINCPPEITRIVLRRKTVS